MTGVSMDAQQTLAIAWSHAQDFIKSTNDKGRGNLRPLQLASQRVEEAAKIDPHITFRWGESTCTIDEIRAHLVRLEAIHYVSDDPKKALPILDQSLRLAYSSPIMLIKAETLVRLERRAEAEAVLEEALRREPNNVNIAKYHDILKANPRRGTGDYGFIYRYYWVLFILGGLMFLSFTIAGFIFGIGLIVLGIKLMVDKSYERELTRRGI